MGYTQDQRTATYERVSAIVNGKLNIEGIKEAFEKKPFEFYLRRFVAEKTDKKPEEITLQDIYAYMKEVTDKYVSKYGIELPKYDKKYIRMCLTYPEDRVLHQQNRARIRENKKAQPERYERFIELHKKGVRSMSTEENEEYRVLSEDFKNIEYREMTRANLMKLFFYLDCSDKEATDLLHRLGEQDFYFNDRYEALVWWSLKQPENKYGKFLELKELLDSEQTRENPGTVLMQNYFRACTSDFEFRIQMVKINTQASFRESTLKQYLSLKTALEQRFNQLSFFNEHSDAIDRLKDEIIARKNRLYSQPFTKIEEVKQRQTIDNRERELTMLKNKHHKKVMNTSSIGEIKALLNEHSSENNLQLLDWLDRMSNIKNGAVKTIQRKDFINAYFLYFVLKEYYEPYCEGLFDPLDFEENDLIELINKFQQGLDTELNKIGFMPTYLGNPYEAFLILCLASGNPLDSLCYSTAAFNITEDE